MAWLVRDLEGERLEDLEQGSLGSCAYDGKMLVA